MRLRHKILSIILLTLIIGYSSLYFFVGIAGKDILAAKAKDMFGREVKVGSANLVFPLSIIVRDFEIPGMVNIREVFAGGGALDIFRRNVILSELRLNRVVVHIEKVKKEEPPKPPEPVVVAPDPAAPAAVETPPVEAPASADAPAVTEQTQPEPAPAVKVEVNEQPSKSPRVTIRHFRVKDSTVIFTDKSVKSSKAKVTIENLNAHIENLAFPIDESNIVSFDVTGNMPWESNGKVTQGRISATGWINLYKRDIQAKLEVKDIDGVSLYPYYDKWVDLEKARIQQAKLRFNSDITGTGGEVKAECHLELTDLVFRPKESGEKEEKAHRIATVVLSMFNEMGGKVAVDFTFKTRMERPNFNLESIRAAVEDKLRKARAAESGDEGVVESAVTFPVKLLEGGVRSGAELSRALIDGVFTIGKSVRNGFHDLVSNSEKKEDAPKQ